MGRILLFFLSFYLLLLNTAKVHSSAKKEVKPLVLQMTISHSRNTDQVSLIFRADKVEMVTNTAHYQKGKKNQLGWFESSITPELNSLKQRLNWYHSRLKKTVSIASLINKGPVPPSSHTPHAPLFRLNKEHIKEGGVFFNELEDIIQQIPNHNWTCVECAEYQKHEKGILRIVRKRQNSVARKPPKNKQASNNKLAKKKSTFFVQKTVLSKKNLNCSRKTKSLWECVDERFGIFEIASR